MDVVGHDDIGMQLVAPEFGTAHDWVFGIVSDFRIREPKRARFGGVQGGVKLQEFLARRLLRAGIGRFRGTAIPGCAGCPEKRGGKGTVEPPSDKDGFAFGEPMRKVAAVEGHKERILAERFAIGEISSEPSVGLRRTARNGCATSA